ncbi:2-dehydropantoate 2-reductase [Paenibacillus sp. BR2-3]|uniref:ketopantoate reductase family protein n=1 Tax=Paenibacillus sp. BR2-3 TaxID=3048494 RepID=UPI003977C91F
MKIDIIGAGSLGMLLAGKLLLAGNEIRLWCRGTEQCRELNRKGLTISYEDHREALQVAGDQFEASTVTEFPERYLQEPADWIVIMVKQKVLHTELKRLLAKLHNRRVHIICFQNGSGHMEMLQELLPDAHLYAAVTTDAAKVVSPSEVIHAGAGSTSIGMWQTSNENAEPEAIRLLENLRLAGFSAFLSNEVENMIYRKLLINAVINPLTAIWRTPNGGLLHSPARMRLMRELFEEAVAVYTACGIVYEVSAWEDILDVCRATSGNISSMLADVIAARTTEIGWINGSIVEMAERSGVAVPGHRWVCRLVEGMIAEEG